MNILVLTHSYPDSSHRWRGIFIQEQARALSLIHNVTVVYFKVDYSDFAPFSGYTFQKRDDEKIIVYEVTVSRSLPVITQLKYLSDTYRFITNEILSSRKIELIHSHLSYPGGLLGTLLQKRKGIPSLLTEHSRLTLYYRSRIHKLCVRYAIRHAGGVIAVSNALKAEIEAEYNRPVSVIHNIVDTERIEIIRRDKGEMLNIGFLGGLGNTNKGLDLLLKALTLTERKDLLLHIGGDGRLIDHYRGMAEELGIASKCIFYGEILRDDIARFYSGLDIFVLPSRYETFGIVLIEAMSCGVPVIATICGGPQDIVTQATGILIGKDNAVELADAINRMSADRGLYDRNVIRTYAKEKFGQAVFIEKISKVYKELVKEETSSEDVKHLYTEDYFLGSATGHNEFRNFNGTFDQLIDKFQMVLKLLNLKKSDSFLDIGCGRGEIVIYHALNGGKASGIDFSGEAIKLARSKAEELKADCQFQVSSFENIDENIKYDRIVSIDFIEHISVAESILFMKKCFNLLNPGGRLIIYTYPNTIRRRYGYKLIRLSGCIKGKPAPAMEPDTISDHYKQYHLNEQNYFRLKKLAAKEGFKKIRVVYYDPGARESFLKSVLLNTPFRHLFLKGLTLIADK